MHQLGSEPWCFGGDFNVVRFPYERYGNQRWTTQMKLFDGFIAYHNLIDPPLKGALFTWSNHQVNLFMSRLDRFLFSTSWEEHFNHTLDGYFVPWV